MKIFDQHLLNPLRLPQFLRVQIQRGETISTSAATGITAAAGVITTKNETIPNVARVVSNPAF
jgi:hypothetical protein